MADFLDDAQVGTAVRKVMSGDEVRCAVAFWGDGAAKALFKTKGRARSARIVCDLTMGGTNPAELVLLGAPDNDDLRHVRGLHAKLYLSDAGLVVASANASNRGIGFVDVPALTECGTLHTVGTQAAQDAADWFERLWERSERVDASALAAAERAWSSRPRRHAPTNAAAAADSLLHRIAADPEAFRGVGVVFTTGEATREDVEEASEIAIEAGRQAPEPTFSTAEETELRAWPHGDLFTSWSDSEVSAWPKTFLCVHRGSRGGLGYWAYERFADARVGPDDWSVFARRSPSTRRLFGLGADPRPAARVDADLLGRIFEALDGDAGHRLCESPHPLQLMLDAIDRLD